MIERSADGLAAGGATAFFMGLGTTGLAVLSGGTHTIPMVFSASAAEENGLPLVEFVPNGLGLSCVIAVLAVCHLLVGHGHSHRNRH